MMTRQERMLSAVRHRPVDRVPFATYGLHPYVTSTQKGAPSYAALLELVVEKAGMLCKLGARRMLPHELPPHMETAVEELEDRRVTTRTLRTPRGDLCSVSVKPAGQPAYTTEHFIKTDGDVERFMSLKIDPVTPDVADAERLSEEVGGRGVVYLGYPDPMNVVAELFDFEDFVIRSATDLPAILRVVDFTFDLIAEQVRRLARLCRGRDFLLFTGGPEKATPPMMPPALFAALVTPYEKRLVDIFHREDLLVTLHCHGKVRLVIDEIMACGFDVLEPIEPPVQGDITLSELMEKCRGRLALMGHIQDQELHNARPGHFMKAMEEIAQVANGRTGYICTPTATPFQFPATERFVRNYTEWIEAADRLFR